MHNSYGVDIDISQVKPCEVCFLAKQQRRRRGPSKPQPSFLNVGRRWELDLAFFGTPSVEGHSCALIATETSTRYREAIPLKAKTQICDAVRQLLGRNTLYHDSIPRPAQGPVYIKIDVEKALLSFENMDELATLGVRLSTSPPYRHDRNGLAESSVRLLKNTVRSLLIDKDIPATLWHLALEHASFLLNRSPTAALGHKTPFSCAFGSNDTMSDVHTFGTTAFARDEDPKSLQDRSTRVIYVGRDRLSHSHRLYNPDTRRTRCSYDVRFNSEDNYFSRETAELFDEDISSFSHDPRDTDWLPDDDVELRAPEGGRPRRTDRIDYATLADVNGTPALPNNEPFFALLASSSHSNLADPSTWAQAMASHDADKWRDAQTAEMDSLRHFNVYEEILLQDVPKDCLVLPPSVVFKRKRDPDGNVTRHKVRVAYRGDRLRPGIDFDPENSTAGASLTAFRLLLARATALGHPMASFDLTAAFVQGSDLSRPVYMRPPKGERQHDAHGRPIALKINKGLYGHPEANIIWQQTLSTFLKGLDFTQSSIDPTVWHGFMDNTPVDLVIWVDDFAVSAPNQAALDKFGKLLLNRFEGRSLGSLDSYLGMSVDRQAEHTTVTMPGYTANLCKVAGTFNAKPKPTPLPANITLSIDDCPLLGSQEAREMEDRPYRSILGAASWLAQAIRPDIRFAVGFLSRYQNNPGIKHWKALMHLTQYLAGTMDLGIRYHRGCTSHIACSDASWLDCLDTRHFTLGLVCFAAAGPVSWSSKRSSAVNLSTCEAEYFGATRATQAARAISVFCEENGWSEFNSIVPLGIDSTSALGAIRAPSVSRKLRHIDSKVHYVREVTAAGHIAPYYVPSASLPADLLTKAVSRTTLQALRPALLGLSPTYVTTTGVNNINH